MHIKFLFRTFYQRSRVMSEMLNMNIFFKKEFKLPTGR